MIRYTVLGLLAAGSFLWVALSFTGDEAFSTPTIGIALSVTFGALSIQHADGSFEDCGRIDGSVDYISLMRRLSPSERKHPSPPYSSMEEYWQDIPRQALRKLRMRLGLPASSDVKILAEMLHQLLAFRPTEEKIGSVVISYPPIMGLYEEDIRDAAAYLDVAVQGGVHFHQPRELVAAFAGHGRGLCDHPEHTEECLEELRRLPIVQVFHVEYTRKAMLFQTDSLRGAQDLASSDIHALALYDFGSDRRNTPGYLRSLQATVTGFVETRQWSESLVTVLILTGEEGSVGDEGVTKAIRFGMEAVGITSLEILDARPEYIAAEGAAELCSRGRMSYIL